MKGLFRSKIADANLPQRQWTNIVPEVQLAMNQKVHSSTNTSPFQLMYGDSKRFDTRKPQLQNTFLESSEEPTTEERCAAKQNSIEKAKERLASTAEKMKSKYDKNTKETLFSIDDLVYIKREQTKKGVSKKLSTVYHELSRVIDTNHPIYKVQRVNSGKTGWIHHNRLRKKVPFEDPDLIVDCPPRIPQATREHLDIDFDEGDDYPMPMIINNSNHRAVEIPTPVINEETDNGNDSEPSVSLDRIENIDNPTAAEPAAPADSSITLGRDFDDNGRLVSTRTRKSTRTEEFDYWLFAKGWCHVVS